MHNIYFVTYICGELKNDIMTKATITKTLNKLDGQPNDQSIGFSRLTVLPKRVRRNINMACIMKGLENDTSMVDLFNSMTAKEFINWLKLA